MDDPFNDRFTASDTATILLYNWASENWWRRGKENFWHPFNRQKIVGSVKFETENTINTVCIKDDYFLQLATSIKLKKNVFLKAINMSMAHIMWGS